MKFRILCVSFVATFVSALWAQNNINDINRIKRDKEYLYGEATLDKKEAALDLAYELLRMEIKHWASKQEPQIRNLIASDINEYTDTIILQRHNMIRAFVYVKLSNLVAIEGRTMAVEVDNNNHRAGKYVKPVAKDLHPVPVESKKNDNNKAIERLLGVSSFYDLEEIITAMKSEGIITDFGKYATMTDPANCYLIIYDQQARIVAILDRGVAKRNNLKTGKVDSEVNYHGCGAIWIKM